MKSSIISHLSRRVQVASLPVSIGAIGRLSACLVLSLCVACSSLNDGAQGMPQLDGVVRHIEAVATDVADEPPPYMQDGSIGVGFVRAEHRDIPPYDRPQTEEFRINAGDFFSPYLILVNNTDATQTFLVTAFLDLVQVDFVLDEREGILHEVAVPPHVEFELPMIVRIPFSGYHDVQVLAFARPYNDTMDIDWRTRFGGYSHSRRAIVIVGDNDVPATVPTILDMGQPRPNDRTFDIGVGFATEGDQHPSDQQLYVDQTTVGLPYAFRVWATNDTGQATNMVLIPLVDYRQRPIGLTNEASWVIHLEPEEEAILDARVTFDTPGVHQVQIVFFYDPYRSILRDETALPFVEGSFRIALQALPAN